MVDNPQGGVAVSTSRPARQPLDQLRILNEAVAFIDQRGLSMLTMRRLGAQLGVEAMALYRYVPGREQLLDGVVEVVMDELYRDTMRQYRPRSWPEYLQQMAHARPSVGARAHPRIFPLVATRPPAAPWLRPPLRSLRWVESFLEQMNDYGFGAEQRRAGLPRVRHLPARPPAARVLDLDQSRGGDGVSDDIAFIETNDLSAYPLVTGLRRRC